MLHNPKNTIIQTALTHSIKFRSVGTEALRWLKITTDTGNKPRIETIFKEIDQKILESLTIYVLNI